MKINLLIQLEKMIEKMDSSLIKNSFNIVYEDPKDLGFLWEYISRSNKLSCFKIHIASGYRSKDFIAAIGYNIHGDWGFVINANKKDKVETFKFNELRTEESVFQRTLISDLPYSLSEIKQIEKYTQLLIEKFDTLENEGLLW